MSIYDKINDGKFKNPIPYPNTPVKPAVLLKRVNNLSDEQINTLVDVKKAYNDAMEAYEAARKAYADGAIDADKRFRQEALNEVGLSDHEARDRAYSLAWEQGHSGGYADVFNHLQEIAFVILGR